MLPLQKRGFRWQGGYNPETKKVLKKNNKNYRCYFKAVALRFF